MSAWPKEESWTKDVSADDLKVENRSSGFKAKPGMFLPVLICLYGAEVLLLPEDASFEDARALVSGRLIGQIMLLAMVVNDQGKIVFTQESRIYA